MTDPISTVEAGAAAEQVAGAGEGSQTGSPQEVADADATPDLVTLQADNARLAAANTKLEGDVRAVKAAGDRQIHTLTTDYQTSQAAMQLQLDELSMKDMDEPTRSAFVEERKEQALAAEWAQINQAKAGLAQDTEKATWRTWFDAQGITDIDYSAEDWYQQGFSQVTGLLKGRSANGSQEPGSSLETDAADSKKAPQVLTGSQKGKVMKRPTFAQVEEKWRSSPTAHDGLTRFYEALNAGKVAEEDMPVDTGA